MTERGHDGAEHAQDVADNPEWTDADIRAGRSLADFAPEMAASIARTLDRPIRRRPHPDAKPELQDVEAP